MKQYLVFYNIVINTNDAPTYQQYITHLDRQQQLQQQRQQRPRHRRSQQSSSISATTSTSMRLIDVCKKLIKRHRKNVMRLMNYNQNYHLKMKQIIILHN